MHVFWVKMTVWFWGNHFISTEKKEEVMSLSLPHSPTCSQIQDSDACCWGGYNLEKNKPPFPNQGWSRAKSKTRHFSVLDLEVGGGGRADVGGINFPSILSKIVVEVIEEKSLRQYIIIITIVPLFNTQHQNLF